MEAGYNSIPSLRLTVGVQDLSGLPGVDLEHLGLAKGRRHWRHLLWGSYIYIYIYIYIYMGP